MTIKINELINDLSSDSIKTMSEKYEEGLHIEFKSCHPLHREGKQTLDKVKNEFIKDLTAFANTEGGVLIYGIDAKERVPVAFTPLEVNHDELETGLCEIIRSRCDPPVAGIRFHRIDKPDKKTILLIHIPRSYNSPHALVDPDRGYPVYYGRNSAGGTFIYDVAKIRETIILRENSAEKIRKYREDRIIRLHDNQGILPLKDYSKVILQLFPLSAFDSHRHYDLENFYNNYKNILPICSAYKHVSRRRNYNGLLVSDATAVHGHFNGYTQLYRTGIIEAADSYVLVQRHTYEGQKFIPSEAYEKDLINALTRYLETLKYIGVNPPIYCAITLIGVQGFRMGIAFNQASAANEPIDCDTLLLPEFEIPSLEDITKHSVAALLKDSFDIVWQACGQPKSLNYDDNNKLIIEINS